MLNVSLNQNLPPMIKKSYVTQDREQVLNACNFKVINNNISLANKEELSKNTLKIVLKYINNLFTSAELEEKHFKPAPINRTTFQNAFPVLSYDDFIATFGSFGIESGTDSTNPTQSSIQTNPIYALFCNEKDSNRTVDKVVENLLKNRERWPVGFEGGLSNREKKCFYYLNYFNYVIQKKIESNPTVTTSFLSLTNYRARINENVHEYTIYLKGNLEEITNNIVKNIQINIMPLLSNAPLYSEILNITTNEQDMSNYNCIYKNNTYIFKCKFSNEQFQLGKTYKVNLKINCENNEEIITNYGLIKCSDFNEMPSIDLSNLPEITLTSFDIAPIYIKTNIIANNVNNNFDLSSVNLQTTNNKYHSINFNQIETSYLNYNVPQFNPVVTEVRNQTTTINGKEISYIPKLESSNLTQGKNCWVISSCSFTNIYSTPGISAFKTASGDVNSYYSSILIIPVNFFRNSNEDEIKYTISLDRSELLERSALTDLQLIQWFQACSFGTIENVQKENELNAKIHGALQTSLNKIFREAGIKNYPVGTSAYFEVNSDNTTFLQKNHVCIYQKSTLCQIQDVTSLNIKILPLNSLNANSIDVSNSLITKDLQPLQYYRSGFSVDNTFYCPYTSKQYSFPALITESDSTNKYNSLSRLYLDISVPLTAKYLAIQFFTATVQPYSNLVWQKLLNSIQIIPTKYNLNKEIILPRKSILMYKYKETIPEMGMIKTDAIWENGLIAHEESNYSVSSNMLNSELTQKDIVFNINNFADKNCVQINVLRGSNISASLNNYNFNIIRYLLKDKTNEQKKIDIIYNFDGNILKQSQTNAGFQLLDFSIDQGETYVYALQPIKKENSQIYLPLIEKEILADFEHIILVDDEYALTVQYNPKVSTFKTIINASKIDTLGSQYPFIRANGYNNYKQFSLGGLLVANQVETIKRDSTWSKNVLNTSIAKDIQQERIYKNQILNWLNNGKNKLLKTATEGNYIVQLMNVSLTPLEQLGRKFHSFTCEAYEVQACTQENMNQFQKYTIIS